MNDELQKALLAIINSITNAVGKAVNFLSDQIPDVIHQLLMWKAVESFIWFIIPFIVATSALVLAYFKEKEWKNNGDDFEQGIMWFISGTISLICFVISFTHMSWLQILIAPKIYLLEYAASLVKGH